MRHYYDYKNCKIPSIFDHNVSKKISLEKRKETLYTIENFVLDKNQVQKVKI